MTYAEACVQVSASRVVHDAILRGLELAPRDWATAADTGERLLLAADERYGGSFLHVAANTTAHSERNVVLRYQVSGVLALPDTVLLNRTYGYPDASSIEPVVVQGSWMVEHSLLDSQLSPEDCMITTAELHAESLISQFEASLVARARSLNAAAHLAALATLRAVHSEREHMPDSPVYTELQQRADVDRPPERRTRPRELLRPNIQVTQIHDSLLRAEVSETVTGRIREPRITPTMIMVRCRVAGTDDATRYAELATRLRLSPIDLWNLRAEDFDRMLSTRFTARQGAAASSVVASAAEPPKPTKTLIELD